MLNIGINLGILEALTLVDLTEYCDAGKPPGLRDRSASTANIGYSEVDVRIGILSDGGVENIES